MSEYNESYSPPRRSLNGGRFYKLVPTYLAPHSSAGHQTKCVLARNIETTTPSFLSDGSFGVSYLYGSAENAIWSVAANIEPILMVAMAPARAIDFVLVEFEVSGVVLDCFDHESRELFDEDTDTQELGHLLKAEGHDGVLFPNMETKIDTPGLCLFDAAAATQTDTGDHVKLKWDGSEFSDYQWFNRSSRAHNS